MLRRDKRFVIIATLGIILIVGGVLAAQLFGGKDQNSALDATDGASSGPLHEPSLKTEELIGGLSNVWDMAFVDQNTIVFNERSGNLRGVSLADKSDWQIATVPNVRAEGEGGLLGLAIDYEFKTNRYMYACYNADGPKRVVKVVRFKLGDDNKTASDFTDIISDIQSQGGRHSGCRLVMDNNNVLWIGTGDSALGTAPQDAKSLAGKVLRVDRNGKGVTGNMGAQFDGRIYNYGHRNIQGIVLLKQALPNGAIGLTSEHGPDKEDEVNWLMPGNFGWNPRGAGNAYDESVPMTDRIKYPEAVPAVWNSGSSTVAVSGMTFLTSSRWSAWRGWVALATLKGQHVRMIQINGDGSIKADQKVLTNFGRIRTVVEAPNGDLYLSTDNGNNTDKIIRVIPE